MTFNPLKKEDVGDGWNGSMAGKVVKLKKVFSAIQGLKQEILVGVNDVSEQSRIHFLFNYYLPVFNEEMGSSSKRAPSAVNPDVAQSPSSCDLKDMRGDGSELDERLFSRVEVINGADRVYVSYEQHSASVQDKGRTLKLFTKPTQSLSQPSQAPLENANRDVSTDKEGCTPSADTGEKTDSYNKIAREWNKSLFEDKCEHNRLLIDFCEECGHCETCTCFKSLSQPSVSPKNQCEGVQGTNGIDSLADTVELKTELPTHRRAKIPECLPPKHAPLKRECKDLFCNSFDGELCKPYGCACSCHKTKEERQ